MRKGSDWAVISPTMIITCVGLNTAQSQKQVLQITLWAFTLWKTQSTDYIGWAVFGVCPESLAQFPEEIGLSYGYTLLQYFVRGNILVELALHPLHPVFLLVML